MAKIRQRFNDVKKTIWFYIQILIGQVPQWHSAIEAVTDSSVDQGDEDMGQNQNITTGYTRRGQVATVKSSLVIQILQVLQLARMRIY